MVLNIFFAILIIFLGKSKSSFVVTGTKNSLKGVTSIKYLGGLIDKHLTWKVHINVIENKVSKN